MDEVGFAIIAPGRIAGVFAHDLALVPGARLVASGSRDLARAQAFAEAHGGRAYGSYDEVLADPEVDVVYLASPNSVHAEQALAALAAGKHVLCEKPLTLDLAQAEAVFAAARTHDRFLREAVWAACHPVWLDLTERVAAGGFGTPRRLRADFCFDSGVGPEHRLRNPALGGGALLDLAVYPLTLAHLLLGEAEALNATGVLDPGRTEDPVDLDVAISGAYPGGAGGEFRVSVVRDLPVVAELETDQGVVRLPARFHHPDHFTFTPHGATPERFDPPEPVIGVGYGHEIAEVARCVREGLRESPLAPWARTRTIMGQLDSLAAQVRQHPTRA